MSDRSKLFFQNLRTTIEKRTSNNLQRQMLSFSSKMRYLSRLCRMQPNRKVVPTRKNKLSSNLSLNCKTNLIHRRRSLKSKSRNQRSLSSQKLRLKKKFRLSNTITSATSSTLKMQRTGSKRLKTSTKPNSTGLR